MHTSRKIVWAEGVFLGQQHFQQWELSINEHYQRINNYQLDKSFGLCQLAINQAELEGGLFKIESIIALMPDGRWLSFNDDFADLSLTIKLDSELENIYLALPRSEVVSGISGYPEIEVNKTAWQADYRSCQDLYDSNREQEVLYAKQQFFLTKDQSLESSCCLLKIAELKKARLNQYNLTKYIAPVMQISASKNLLDLLIQIRNELKNKISQLKLRFKTSPAIAIRDNSSLSYDLMLLTALSKNATIIAHFELQSLIRPKELYIYLTQFIAELNAFVLGDDVEVKAFDNNNLQELFEASQTKLFELLEMINPVENTSLVLNKQSELLYHSENLKEILANKHYIYLEVKVNQETPDWNNRFERGIKLGSTSKIHEIFASAVSGIKLKYTKRPPSAITVKPNCEYFQILTEGTYWQHVIEEEYLAILISKEFMFVELNLILVES